MTIDLPAVGRCRPLASARALGFLGCRWRGNAGESSSRPSGRARRCRPRRPAMRLHLDLVSLSCWSSRELREVMCYVICEVCRDVDCCIPALGRYTAPFSKRRQRRVSRGSGEGKKPRAGLLSSFGANRPDTRYAWGASGRASLSLDSTSDSLLCRSDR